MKRISFILMLCLSCLTSLAQNPATSAQQLVDYCMNTPADGFWTAKSVETIKALVAKNRPTPVPSL